MNIILSLVGGGVIALSLSLLIILTQRWHGSFTFDRLQGIQKIHKTPTPRIGGLGVLAGLGVAYSLAPPSTQSLLQPMLIASLLPWSFGIMEDITQSVGITMRLLATIGGGVLVCWLSDTSLTELNLWGIDHFLRWSMISVVFTAFAVGGIANSINIVDGVHGLASGLVILGCTSIGLIAYHVGDLPLASACMIIGSVTLGFLCVNFPFGKLFLGDGGAYCLGFLIAWLAVLLVERNPNVSAWAGLMALAYPLTEVLFSLWRRKQRHLPVGYPDRLHLHSLIQNRIMRQNAGVAPLIWGFASLPAAFAVLAYTSTTALIIGFGVFLGLYILTYRYVVQFKGIRAMTLTTVLFWAFGFTISPILAKLH